MTEQIPHMCQTCHRTLDWYAPKWDSTEGEWVHSARTRLDPTLNDHPAVPIPIVDLGDLVSTCDFCSADGSAWTYPCDSFEDRNAGYASVGSWGACADCHTSIEAGDWEAVTRRALANHRTLHGKFHAGQKAELRHDIEYFHRLFRKHRVGDPFPLFEDAT